ncbi:YolD-like family protein [Siminovitchia acidinfaciens]|uniref:YolD-like family protein n=1 Tax=Siminovitchia acidinfaciens TaxID=2321395 RepID=A0A429Y220_9BACI|nr:YolD-like family protein [Siminovitchia acidinfaciens]RST75260.1 YolD-like family protein [Siminovitchia acidinfaciens]
MDIKDRGTKKWTAMMLPEHVQMLKYLNVDYERVKKPDIDEQGWEEINETLHIAIEFNLPLNFTVWIDGFFDDVEGVLHYIDEINKIVHVVDIKENVHRISFKSIVEVEYKN